jgi:hypothetical protein
MSYFDGNTITPEDFPRLNEQLTRVFTLMRDGEWRTLEDISSATGDPQPSVSARLRDLRKPRFGAFEVSRNYQGNGLYVYRLAALNKA